MQIALRWIIARRNAVGFPRFAYSDPKQSGTNPPLRLKTLRGFDQFFGSVAFANAVEELRADYAVFID